MDLMTIKSQDILVRDTFPSLKDFRKEMFAIKKSPRGRAYILSGLYELLKIVREHPKYIALAHAMRPVFRILVEDELKKNPIQTIKWFRDCEDERLFDVNEITFLRESIRYCPTDLKIKIIIQSKDETFTGLKIKFPSKLLKQDVVFLNNQLYLEFYDPDDFDEEEWELLPASTYNVKIPYIIDNLVCQGL